MKALVIALLVCAAGTARAQMGAVSPGKLSSAHASIESQCNRCHVPFGGLPSARCLGCHKALAERIDAGIGLHAQVKSRPCVDCHREHHGRDAAIAPPLSTSFDHRATRFALTGAHEHAPCTRCHASRGASTQWVGLATSCASCHADRTHKGTLGSACAKCHTTTSWTPATRTIADHEVPMTGGHASLPCASCHRSGQHLVAEQRCAQCHRQPHGGTRAPCDTCHGVSRWDQLHYKHSFPPDRLPGKHQTARCLSCHPKFEFKAKFDCASCHTKDRPHEPLGECTNCHTLLSWRSTFEHDLRFALTGGHATATCAGCHRSPGKYRGETKNCNSCHADVHRKQFATQSCGTCHVTRAWKPSTVTSVQHARFDFALTGDHVGAACASCHAKGTFTTTTSECASCHRDPHRKQFAGRACSDCHSTNTWATSTITPAQHDSFGFALRGKHTSTACASCHAKGAFATVTTACASCHADRRHRGRLGSACARCHDERSWAPAKLDHSTTGFQLTRGHANVACAKCHGQGGMQLANAPAPTSCITCHKPKHRDQFGPYCIDCHTTATFRVTGFDHANRTDFPLERRHAALPCMQCHDATKRPVIDRECRTCHGDPHRGSNAFDCADCHRADRWRVVRFDHDLTAYPLEGRHRVVACGRCHTNPNWTGVRTDCVACHAFDRPRDATHLTEATCDDCHTQTSWKAVRQ